MAKEEEVKKDKKAEEGGEEGADAAEGVKKGGRFSPKALLANKRKLIMIVAPLILVIILGAAGYIFFLKPSGGGEPAGQVEQAAAEAQGEDADTATEEEAGEGEGEGEGDLYFGGKSNIFEMKPFVVNLQDNSGTRYLKLTIGVELDSNASKKELKKMKPRVRNSLIILLSSKSYTEIGSIQGKYKLRDEIVERINNVLQGDKVKTVYFTEFVVQ